MIRDVIIQIAKIAKETAAGFDDEKALEVPFLYPDWKKGKEYKIGNRVIYQDTLYKVLTTHTSQDGWTPADSPSLFAPILPGQDGTVGEWKQPDSTNPYMVGDKVTYNGIVYVSTIDNNIWCPADYPTGWKQT